MSELNIGTGKARRFFGRILLLILALVAMGSALSAAKTSSASFSKTDLKVTVKGKQYGLMEDAKALIKTLGKYELSESISCAYDGMDKMYSFKGAVVCTLPINKKDMTDEIRLTSASYATGKGVKVGQSKKEIVAAYGSGYTEDDGIITYWAGKEGGLKTPRMYFEMKKDRIKAIGIYGAKNAG